MDNRPQIGVIIASYNDGDFLKVLFESLYSTSPGASFTPLVVDDHSSDGTEVWIRQNLNHYSAVIRPNEKAYFTRANNAGLHWFKNGGQPPDFYFLLNSDTVVTDGWAGALVATSLKMNAGIVGATLLYPDGRIQHAGAYGVGYHFGIGKPWLDFHGDRYVPWVTGGAMCIRADVLENVGYLPTEEEIGQYDDSDRNYCTRARLYGYEVAQSAGCVIYHHTHEAEEKRRRTGQYDDPRMRRKDR